VLINSLAAVLPHLYSLTAPSSSCRRLLLTLLNHHLPPPYPSDRLHLQAFAVLPPRPPCLLPHFPCAASIWPLIGATACWCTGKTSSSTPTMFLRHLLGGRRGERSVCCWTQRDPFTTAHESVPKPVPDFLVFGVPELVFDLGSPHTRCEIGFFLRWCPCWADLYSRFLNTMGLTS